MTDDAPEQPAPSPSDGTEAPAGSPAQEPAHRPPNEPASSSVSAASSSVSAQLTGADPLGNYTRRMRAARSRYAALIVAGLLVIGVLVGIAWSRSEIHNVHTHVEKNPPTALAIGQLSTVPQVAWRTGDIAAVGYPMAGGTVVTHDQHTVRGRNVRTGAQTWYYTRSDRTVCAAIQQSNVVIAVYRLKGACNELTAMDAQTGRRIWTRTVDMDGYPLLGTPQIQVSTYTVLFVTGSVIYAIDPVGGLTRYYYAPQRCTINRAVLGGSGLLISQTCHHPDCSNRKFCADGVQLVMRDANAGRSDQYSDQNPDRILWMVKGDRDVPLAADNLVLALNPTSHQLAQYAADTGARTVRPLSPVPTSTVSTSPVAVTAGEVLHIGTTTYFVPTSSESTGWSAPTNAPVTITPDRPAFVPDLDASLIAATGPGGIRRLDPGTGRQVTAYAAGSTDGLAYPVGTGFLVAGTAGTTVYR